VGAEEMSFAQGSIRPDAAECVGFARKQLPRAHTHE
jgi:hypothetical protein